MSVSYSIDFEPGDDPITLVYLREENAKLRAELEQAQKNFGRIRTAYDEYKNGYFQLEKELENNEAKLKQAKEKNEILYKLIFDLLPPEQNFQMYITTVGKYEFVDGHITSVTLSGSGEE